MMFRPELIYIFDLNCQSNEEIFKIDVRVLENRYTTKLLVGLHKAMPLYSARGSCHLPIDYFASQIFSHKSNTMRQTGYWLIKENNY